FVNIDAVKSCITPGVRERAPNNHYAYFAFTDVSGGSGDSMALAIAHQEGRIVVLDCIREIRAPFNPEAATAEFAEVLRKYRVASVTGDRYGGEWPREVFRRFGIHYQEAERAKSELYVDLLPSINARTVDLLDSDRLTSQLCGL